MDLRWAAPVVLVILATAGCSPDQSGVGSQVSSDVSVVATPDGGSASAQSLGPAEQRACGIALPQGLGVQDQIAQTLVVFQPLSGELNPRWAPHLGGIFLEHAEVPAYLLRMKSESVFAPFIAADDEGGRVQWRDDPAHPLPAAYDLGQLPLDDLTAMVRSRGEALRAAGLDVTFAPVVDLYPGTRDGVIGDRAFSESPEQVSVLAGAYAQAFEEAGLITTIKHFPGHGLASGDSHLSLPMTAPLSVLEERDLMPFRELIDSGPQTRWVMTGHLDVPGMTAGQPASLSPDAYRYLRKDLGQQGLIITDELSGMQAIAASYSPAQAVIKALKAGADLALIANPGDLAALIAEVEEAVVTGKLPRQRVHKAADRVLAAKACARSG